MCSVVKTVPRFQTVRDKIIIASHISNDLNKQRYLDDNIKGGCYIVSNLDFDDIKDYDFDDNNVYVFVNCIIKDLELSFKK